MTRSQLMWVLVGLMVLLAGVSIGQEEPVDEPVDPIRHAVCTVGSEYPLQFVEKLVEGQVAAGKTAAQIGASLIAFSGATKTQTRAIDKFGAAYDLNAGMASAMRIAAKAVKADLATAKQTEADQAADERDAL